MKAQKNYGSRQLQKKTTKKLTDMEQTAEKEDNQRRRQLKQQITIEADNCKRGSPEQKTIIQ